MDENMINIKIGVSFKESDLIKVMNEYGLKTTKTNKDKFIKLLSERIAVVNEEFVRIKFDKEDFLIRGLRFKQKK